MFSGSSSLNQLHLVPGEEDSKMVKKIQRIMTVPGIISDLKDHSQDINNEHDQQQEAEANVVKEKRIVVANQLPVITHYDKENKRWCFDWDKDALALQLKDGFPSEAKVYYVGCLKEQIHESQQDEVFQFLVHKFRCVPVFLEEDVKRKYYHGFCKHYLWPLFHYMLPMPASTGARFDKEEWRAYWLANKAFADAIVEVIDPEKDYVWLHDYHLLMMPFFLRKSFLRIQLGFFLHSPFPSSEIFKTLPVREQILMSLLNCDLIGFHTFDYARHFLTCCSRILGVDYESKRGYIGLDYYGRTVSIKILPVGIHMGQLELVLSLPETAKKVKQLKEQLEGKTVMLGVDDMDMFKGIGLKFQAMERLLDKVPEFRGKVVLVQIVNPARSQGKDIEDVKRETDGIANRVNERYGEPGYKPIVLVKEKITTAEKAAYYAISDCCVVNALRDGMNLVPYTYTVCRQGSPALDEALGIDGPSVSRKSVIIVSEFIGCSPSLSGAIRVNPWDFEAVSGSMYRAVGRMKEEEKQLRHEKHYRYISSHDVAYWARSFDQDVERACTNNNQKSLVPFGGLNFTLRVVGLDPNFKRLSIGDIKSAYKNTSSRLILLDYDGTIMPKGSEDKSPSNGVISVLNDLCSEPQNTVFIVSGRGKESLSNWFSPCEKLGISAEHGYYNRWTRDDPWECGMLRMDLEWKNIAEPVMQLYTEATDGSFIEYKETGLVWHYEDAHPDFGSCQAKELLDHLENVLANEPVVVHRGDGIVEIKPQGVSKGLVVEKLISTMRSKGKSPEFVLCIGDDRSDEDMFSSPSLQDIADVFNCIVALKPTKAKYYLDDTDEVIGLLKGLTAPEGWDW